MTCGAICQPKNWRSIGRATEKESEVAACGRALAVRSAGACAGGALARLVPRDGVRLHRTQGLLLLTDLLGGADRAPPTASSIAREQGTWPNGEIEGEARRAVLSSAKHRGADPRRPELARGSSHRHSQQGGCGDARSLRTGPRLAHESIGASADRDLGGGTCGRERRGAHTSSDLGGPWNGGLKKGFRSLPKIGG
jgi:hypothetical protein